MAKPIPSGPRDAAAVFVRSGALTVVDARGNIWKYDTSVTEDANGEEITAPASIDEAYLGPSRDTLLALAGDTMWTYDMKSQTWHEGVSVDEQLPGEAERTGDPWKRGHNVASEPAPADTAPAKGKKKAKQHEEA